MGTLPQPAGSASPPADGPRRSRGRALGRIAASAGLTAAFALRPLATAILTLGSRVRVVRSGTRAFHGLCRRLAGVLGLRIGLAGPAVPPGPCLVCPNHVSYLDILVLAWTADAVFVSRGDVAGWPGIGPLAKLGGTVFLDRSRKRDAARAADTIGEWLDRGFRVVVFLEGRNGTGDAVLPFRSPLLEPACARGVPCVPVAMRYALPRDPGATVARDVAWVDDTPFGTHAFRLAGLRGPDVSVRVGAPRTGSDRKALAAALEADVRAMLAAPTPASDPSPAR